MSYLPLFAANGYLVNLRGGQLRFDHLLGRRLGLHRSRRLRE